MRTLLLLFLLLWNVGYSQVFYAQDEAIGRAFPGAGEVNRKNIVITSSRATVLSERYKAPVNPGISSYFEGLKEDGTLLGYAFIDSGVVRTHNGVFMVVMLPDGTLRDVFVLAFNEPPEYLPNEKWLGLLQGKALSEAPVVGKNVPPIMGSTLTVNAITRSIRRVQGIFKEFLKPEN
jgi:electron transport complex protein RnfG